MIGPNVNLNKQEKAVRLEERSRIAAYLREKAQGLSWIPRTILESAADEIMDGEHWRKQA